MDSGFVMLIGIIFIGIVIGYFVGKKIEDKFRERNTRKAMEYADGFKIRWTSGSLRELYAKKYNTEIEPAESEIIKMFNDIGVTISTYDETHITIPWKYIAKWERVTLSNGENINEFVLIYFVNEENRISMHLSLTYYLDPVYMALAKYVGEKEDIERPTEKSIKEVQRRSDLREISVLAIIAAILYIISNWL